MNQQAPAAHEFGSLQAVDTLSLQTIVIILVPLRVVGLVTSRNDRNSCNNSNISQRSIRVSF